MNKRLLYILAAAVAAVVIAVVTVVWITYGGKKDDDPPQDPPPNNTVDPPVDPTIPQPDAQYILDKITAAQALYDGAPAAESDFYGRFAAEGNNITMGGVTLLDIDGILNAYAPQISGCDGFFEIDSIKVNENGDYAGEAAARFDYLYAQSKLPAPLAYLFFPGYASMLPADSADLSIYTGSHGWASYLYAESADGADVYYDGTYPYSPRSDFWTDFISGAPDFTLDGITDIKVAAAEGGGEKISFTAPVDLSGYQTGDITAGDLLCEYIFKTDGSYETVKFKLPVSVKISASDLSDLAGYSIPSVFGETFTVKFTLTVERTYQTFEDQSGCTLDAYERALAALQALDEACRNNAA
ncbi:MAG: hypothetical protein FWE62_04760 [Firmicutes bacterium]|nr:hypothetical protein [Bacillota bacterium]